MGISAMMEGGGWSSVPEAGRRVYRDSGLVFGVPFEFKYKQPEKTLSDN